MYKKLHSFNCTFQIPSNARRGEEGARVGRPGDGRARRGESGARSGRGAGEEAGEDGMDVSCDET